MEDDVKYLVIGGQIVDVGTEAYLVNEAIGYDDDYEILDEDELPENLRMLSTDD